MGTTGLGKTHLSTAVAERVIERGFDVLYVSATAMLADFEEKRFGNASAAATGNDTERYYGCDLLIIDDLGAEVVNKFTQAYLYDVINSRMNNRKCTVINTNLTPTEIMSVYAERIHSRIFGEYLPLPFVADGAVILLHDTETFGIIRSQCFLQPVPHFLFWSMGRNV